MHPTLVMALEMSSAAFENEGEIPGRHTALGESINPELRWSGVPEGTHEFALICEDPDAPSPRPFVHWIVYGIPPSISYLPEGLAASPEIEVPVFARQGLNSLAEVGFTGPNPPFWHRRHRYVFRLFALRRELGLRPGVGREDFYAALDGKILEEARLVGVYGKPTFRRLRAGAAWSAVAFGAAIAIGLGRRRARVRGERGRPRIAAVEADRESRDSGVVSPERNRIVEEHFKEHPEGDPAVRRIRPDRGEIPIEDVHGDGTMTVYEKGREPEPGKKAG